jgi:hypothetical protein
MCTYALSNSSLGSVFAYGAGGWGSIPNAASFLITMSIMALVVVTFRLFFLIYLVISSFIYIQER